MARYFKKISFEQFKKDLGDNKELYDSIVLPTRSTSKSAGYDIRSMEDGIINPGEYKRFKTGLKVCMNDDEVLYIYSRSSLGYKHGVTMVNSVGVIDADFYNNPDNEGHFSVCLINQSDTPFEVNVGDRVAQGVFMKYLMVDNEEEVVTKRSGGFGSTGRKGNE